MGSTIQIAIPKRIGKSGKFWSGPINWLVSYRLLAGGRVGFYFILFYMVSSPGDTSNKKNLGIYVCDAILRMCDVKLLLDVKSWYDSCKPKQPCTTSGLPGSIYTADISRSLSAQSSGFCVCA